MKKKRIIVRVYNDGDTELTAVELTDSEKKEKEYEFLVFDVIGDGLIDLSKELKSYGHEEQNITKSIKYVLDPKTPNTCIVNKI
jgi:hypothetical protein